MRILHVDDDEDTRTLVTLVLRSEGWEVVSADSTAAALDHAADGPFDLYLIDNWMGDADGPGNDLCLKLRSLDGDTPILFYSGAVYPIDVEMALAAGAQGYIAKPCSPEALVNEIRKLIRLTGKKI